MLRIRWIVYLVVMIALFPACNSVFSQVRPNYQINLMGTYHADAEIKDGDYFQGDKDEIRKRDFSASYQYFLYMNDKLTLIPGISFEKSGFKYDIGDKIFAGGAPDRLCSLRFKLTGSYSFVEAWG